MHADLPAAIVLGGMVFSRSFLGLVLGLVLGLGLGLVLGLVLVLEP